MRYPNNGRMCLRVAPGELVRTVRDDRVEREKWPETWPCCEPRQMQVGCVACRTAVLCLNRIKAEWRLPVYTVLPVSAPRSKTISHVRHDFFWSSRIQIFWHSLPFDRFPWMGDQHTVRPVPTQKCLTRACVLVISSCKWPKQYTP